MNLNLTKILKDCPKGWKFYSSIYGEVMFLRIEDDIDYPIRFLFIKKNEKTEGSVTKEGIHNDAYNGECTFFPSKEQRDWNKFSAPWYKREKFDPKTLKPFDKVLVKCTSIYNSNLVWRAELFSYFYIENNSIRFYTLGSDDNSPKSYVIPYNDDTKHLVNTEIEAPEFYRYWED